jgi:hypothetical protein
MFFINSASNAFKNDGTVASTTWLLFLLGWTTVKGIFTGVLYMSNAKATTWYISGTCVLVIATTGAYTVKHFLVTRSSLGAGIHT